MQELTHFQPTKDFLVCVDSDGCAMDTMTVKHKTCFGPQFVEVYGFQEYRKEIQKLWENINLYTKTRGINRFQGLALALRTIRQENLCPMELEFDRLEAWTKETPSLSNDALKKAIEKTGDPQLELALKWSLAVNQSIAALPEGNYSYQGVRDALKVMAEQADIVVVSSANSGALVREWESCGLTGFLSAMAGQEHGTKAAVIAHLLKATGHPPHRVLMVGDAVGDLRAAQDNRVLFYPILAGREVSSWEMLAKEAFGRFLSCSYAGLYQDSRIQAFDENLT